MRNAIADAAQVYRAAGLCVLPAVRAEKRPALGEWKQYQRELPDEGLVASWCSFAEALCVVAGRVSGNLEILDFDAGGELLDAWRAKVAETDPTLLDRLIVEQSPSGGYHVFYRCRDPVCGNMKLAQRVIHVDGPTDVAVAGKRLKPRRDAEGRWHVVVTTIETRGEGGLCLCAPTPGYEPTQGTLDQVPTLTAAERETLLEAAWALNEYWPSPVGSSTPTGGENRPGDAFNAEGDVRAVLVRHGWTRAKPAGPDGNEHWRRPGKQRGGSATLKDGLFYVFSTNAHPFEANRAYTPFAVYTLLEHGGDFTRAASELARQGYGEKRVGVDLSAFLKQPPATPESPFMSNPVSVGDLVSTYPRLREPVIHGLLRQGETMNVIAAPKRGKSWLTIDLAIAVATGRPWLGRYPTEQGDVLIIDNELHRETSAHRIPLVAKARGIDMREIGDRLCVDNLRGRLRDIFTFAPYFDSLEPGRFKVIVLDAFYRFMPPGGDENDNGTMANIYNAIDRFADKLGCSFVLIHHSTKGNQSGKSVTDIGAGAGAQSRATDTHLVLRPHEEEDVVVLDAAVRSWQPIEPVCLRFDFPVWSVDEACEPTLYTGKQKKPAKPAKPAEPEWTAERFVEECMPSETVTLAQLREIVKQMPGLSLRRLDDLLIIAEDLGLIRRERLPGRGGRVGFIRSDGNNTNG